MRTLTFGDRTISYDAGLDTINIDPSTSDSQFYLSNSSERKVSVAKSESADSGVEADALEIQDDNDNEDYSETERRVIRPDDFAVRELLNFDEEEEDDYIEDESEIEDDDVRNRLKEARNHSLFNKKWRQAIVKDLTRRTDHSHNAGAQLTRSDSLDQVLHAAGDNSEVKLSLSEVGHIRRVLARAELEVSLISPVLKLEVEAGRVCGVCHTSRLGGVVRGRGVACELCRVMACPGCVEVTGRVSRDTEYHIQDIPRHLLAPENADIEDKEERTRHNCAGSAPNSPRSSGHMALPLQPPLVTSRRWSMAMWHRRTQQEDDSVTVCIHCKSMVKQILRTRGYNKRM